MALMKARIQVRRGLYEDFNPSKMTAGEWAVSVDTETDKQVVWMCFSPGVVKRMGTLEDFEEQIREATDDIRVEYENALNEIKQATVEETTAIKDSAINETNSIKESAISETTKIKEDAVSELTQIKTDTLNQAEQIRQQAIKDLETLIQQFDTDMQALKREVIVAKESVDASHTYISGFEKELKETLIPKIEGYLKQTEDNAKLAERWAVGREDMQESLTDNSKYYSEQAKIEHERARQEADRASQYSDVVVPSFHIDFTTMELIQENTGKGIEFTLENGELKFEFVDQGGEK